MRILIFVILLLAYSWTGKAQEGMITGTVLDDSGKGIAYVNVLLLNRSDSAFVRGVVTDEEGRFKIGCERPEGYILRFSSVGYRELYAEARGGDVRISAEAYSVEEVTVSGKRPVYKMKGTALVTDVEHSLLSDIGSANDVLRQLPGVMGSDGEFQVFGKGKATIYINNRPVRDASELERLNSNEIASVELINNPGAGYDAEVRAVLLIHTRKKREGFASQLRLRGVQNHYFSDLEQLNLSYASERLNWYALLYSNGPRSRVDGRNRMSTWMPDTLYELSMEMMDWRQYARYYTLESGLGINLAQDQEIGISYAYDFSRGIYEGPDLQTLSVNGVAEEAFTNTDYTNDKYNQHKINLYYLGKIAGKLGINLNADYVRRDADGVNDVWETKADERRQVHALSNSEYNLYAGKLILSYPLWNGKLEVGTDLSLMDQAQVYVNESHVFPDSRFDTEEWKTAAFFNYSGKVGKLGWNAGLRYERFHAKYREDNQEETTVEHVYKELYPTLSLTYPAGPVSLSLSYSKRTARPSFYQLRNSIDYTSRFLYSRGNPYLRSSQIHDLSLNAGYRFLQFSLGYYHTKDWMRMTDELLPSEPLVIVLFHKNEPKFRGLNAQLTFQHRIGPWSPTWTGGIYRSFLDLYDDTGDRIDLDNPYGHFALRNSFSLGRGFVLNMDGYYTTAGVQGQARMRPEGSVDIGLRNSFLNGTLDVSLQIRDIFKTSKTDMVIYTERLRYERWGYQDSRDIRLTLTYRFNKYRKQYKGVNSAGSEIYRM